MGVRKDSWWEAGDDSIGERVFATFKTIDNDQSAHKAQIRRLYRLYSNRRSIRGDDEIAAGLADKLKLNVIKSVIDAGVAQMGTNRPRPMYLTERGNYSMRLRAKRLGKFIAGQFYAAQQYRKGRRVFLHAGITGTGLEKIYEIGGKIHIDHVPAEEVLVDSREAVYGEPRSMYHHKQVDREVAIAAYPKHRHIIEMADYVRDDIGGYRDTTSDPVSAIESWHLPSHPGAKDGRHVIAFSSGSVLVEPWHRETFPIKAFRISEAPEGYWGIGWAEELIPIQLEINFTLMKIQEIANNVSNTLWMRRGENHGRVTNKIGGINYYTGAVPQVLNMGSIPPELLQHVQFLEQKAYQTVGISQLSASSLKPAGLSSGEALKTYNDIGSQRFQHVGQSWEEFHVFDVAEGILDCARDVEERGDGGVEVLAQGDRDVERIRFADVSIDKDLYTTKVWPVSLFPDTPAGKLDTIEKLAQVSPDIQRYLIPLLDFPDFDAVRDRVNAPYELVEKQLEAMLEYGRPQTPLSFMNFDEARMQANLALLQAEKDDVPEERIELVRDWLDKIDEMMAPKEPPAPPMAPQQAQPPGPVEIPGPPEAGMPPMIGPGQ